MLDASMQTPPTPHHSAKKALPSAHQSSFSFFMTRDAVAYVNICHKVKCQRRHVKDCAKYPLVNFLMVNELIVQNIW